MRGRRVFGRITANLLIIMSLFFSLSISAYATTPTEEWSRTYGGISTDLAYSVQQTSDDGYIIGASTKSKGAGDFDMWLIKTDDNGDIIWDKTYGASMDQGATCAIETADGE